PGIPPYVDALVARATARDTDLRPADARVLLHQVRRVRNALDHGVVSDPDLMQDLTPTTPVGGTRTPTGELPAQIIEPQDLSSLADDSSSDDGFYDQERDSVASRQAPPRDRPPTIAPTPGRSASAPRRPRRSRRGAVLLTIVIVLALLAALGGWYLGVARYTSTPGVINLSEAAARAKLDDEGLSLKVSKESWSETVAKGAVISTDPGPGDRVLKDGTVGAVISLGPERHKVPNVKGQTLDDAQQALDDAKLEFGEAIERFDEKITTGRVIGTDPAPATPLRRNTAVDVIVSKGPRPITIPNYAGRPAAAVEKALEKLGFKVESTEVNSDTVPVGRVVTQSPDSGTGQKGDVISLVVSKGPVMVDVPDVIGMGLEAATARLEAAGFKVTVRRASLYVGVQYVVATDPGRNSSAPKGSTVVVSVV
ncbi:MAG: PASTA domain-containing protein, partial [Marmoricola sp.]